MDKPQTPPRSGPYGAPAGAGGPDAETIAVIDLGTNTFHLMIVDFDSAGSYVIREKFKETVKLGEGGITQGTIAPEAYARGIAALERFSRIIAGKPLARVLAFGTSALRGATNAKQFVADAKARAGIDIRIINGNEEALLIYKGVRSGFQLPYDDNALLIDIGGGSVEFIVGTHHQAKLLRSLKLGAARLLEAVPLSDPITPRQIAAVRAICAEQAAGLMEEIRDFSIGLIVGSSGSFETLGAMIAHESGDMLSVERLNGYRFDRKKFKRVAKRILDSTRAERLAIPGMDTTRVDMIVPGVILIDYVLTQIETDTIAVSAQALKDGILYDYLETGRDRVHAPAERSLREKAIKALGRRYEYDADHGAQVSRLALALFDQLAWLHGYGAEERELLKYAAMLHDVGHFINRSGHHKHGQYIVMNAGLQGFTANELLLLGNIIRYHRKSLPSREHFHFSMLYREHKEIVMRLGGLLRLADNLDRSHTAAVRAVKATFGQPPDDVLQVDVSPEAGATLELELEAVRGATELFEAAFGLLPVFRKV